MHRDTLQAMLVLTAVNPCGRWVRWYRLVALEDGHQLAASPDRHAVTAQQQRFATQGIGTTMVPAWIC